MIKKSYRVYVLSVVFEFNDKLLHTKNNTERRPSVSHILLFI